MSITIYIAHAGTRLSADPRKFPSYAICFLHLYSNADKIPSLENLQTWLSQKTTVDIHQQILMTARGKQVKLQTLQQEVYLTLSHDRAIDSDCFLRTKYSSMTGEFSHHRPQVV